eukprot:349641-Chlamydomonas_euryale.AAC.18
MCCVAGPSNCARLTPLSSFSPDPISCSIGSLNWRLQAVKRCAWRLGGTPDNSTPSRPSADLCCPPALRPVPPPVQTAKVLTKTGDWNVICCVRDRTKMERVAQALEFPKGSYTIEEVDLRSLTSVKKLCSKLTSPIG